MQSWIPEVEATTELCPRIVAPRRVYGRMSLMPEVGECIVGAYLKVIQECDVIDYNARPPGGGLKGLGELDVIGLDFKTQTAYLCEVTTHITGLLITDADTTVKTIQRKYSRQQDYAHEFLTLFPTCRFMFWSPKVTDKRIIEGLKNISGLEVVINATYKERIEELRERAKTVTHDTNNPFFRALQIMEHLRE